jgi:AraC-like DNA-binding protein
MRGRFRVAKLLAERLQARRVPLASVLRHAGLPPAFFKQDRIYASTSELFALWRAIGEISADPGIGLKMGSEPRIEHCSPTAIAAVCSRSLRDALVRIGRYKRLTCPEEIRLQGAPGEVAVEFVYTEASDHEPDILVDLALSWILSIGRRGMDGQLTPLRIELVRAPLHAGMLEQHYGCSPRFKARRNALVFRAADMDRAFVTHNEDVLAMIGAQLDLELSAVNADPDLADQVKRTVKRSLAGKRPVLQQVAQELGLSERTLQRRLTAAGSSFQHVAEEARRELARHYLGESAVAYQEVAFLLGYEDANSFFRAFHHWEGTSPGEWRAKHGRLAATGAEATRADRRGRSAGRHRRPAPCLDGREADPDLAAMPAR